MDILATIFRNICKRFVQKHLVVSFCRYSVSSPPAFWTFCLLFHRLIRFASSKSMFIWKWRVICIRFISIITFQTLSVYRQAIKIYHLCQKPTHWHYSLEPNLSPDLNPIEIELTYHLAGTLYHHHIFRSRVVSKSDMQITWRDYNEPIIMNITITHRKN